MAKRMLIDANHQDETRVVVYNDNRLEEFDYESASRKQLKGNIYLAKVTRVEPSLQAAFVEYGGNRQGFLSFSEIHPDYYRIPIADRQALIAQETSFEDDADNGNGGPDSSADHGADAAPVSEPSDDANNSDDPDSSDEADGKVEEVVVEAKVDTVGGDEVEDASRRRAKRLRRYKIQEVIKRRQVILVQVSKEERGTKGAALTTYLSLAGRYCVLMPNTGKGGGISRKIANASDRRRLKKVVSELEIPDGMAVIVRTAGSERTKVEIRRDYEYLVRLWNEIRETTLSSTAPSQIYEEANLIKRALRDLYTRDMDEILVEGETGYKAAKAFVKNMIPSHARKVKLYKEETAPLFHKYHVESQLDAMHSATVQLKSGGYIVINPTEALVAIDVNSGKATRERHIEETARTTNLEAAEEVARQLRLRDLAGLIVIDFIDMEESRHNRDVERRLKDSMRQDRARIQLGRISPFGLLELSRQRLRPSLFESSTVPCVRCGGSGHIRSAESTAHHVIRALEEDAIQNGGGELVLGLPTEVAFYLMNHMRGRLTEIEQNFGLTIQIERDDSLVPPEIRLTRAGETRRAQPAADSHGARAKAEDDDSRRRRGGRRRRRGRDEDDAPEETRDRAARGGKDSRADEQQAEESRGDESRPAEADGEDAGARAEDSSDERGSRRRRGRRGGRRRARKRREPSEQEELQASESMPQPDLEEAPDVSAPAEAQADGEAAPVNDDSGEPPAPKARSERPRRRRRSAKRDDDVAQPEDVQPDEPKQTEAAPDDGAEPDAVQPEEAPPAKKRTRRRKTAKSPQDTAPEAVPSEAVPSEAPEQTSGDEPTVEATEPEKAEPEKTEPEPDMPASDDGPSLFPLYDGAPPAEPASQPDAPDLIGGPSTTPDDPDRPKRKGWWQRWV